MQFSTIFVATFAAFAAAAPAPATTDSVTGLVTRDSGSCVYTQDVVKRWEIKIDSAQDNGVCDGFLANLKPHCTASVVSCSQVGSVKVMNFLTEVTCPDSRVQDTIWIATSPNLGGVTCVKQ